MKQKRIFHYIEWIVLLLSLFHFLFTVFFVCRFLLFVQKKKICLLALGVFVLFVAVIYISFSPLKHQQPSSCGYQYYQLPSKIRQTIFYHLHLYRQKQLSYRRSVEVAYL